LPNLPNNIAELAPLIRRSEISPVEVTRICLDRIEALNPSLNAFITVAAAPALDAARAAEAEIARGQWRGPLHGVPIALKDLIDTAGVRTTSGSALHKDRIPSDDAEVVRRLKRAGAVIVGKNNLHEFAYGGSSLVSYFGDMHNPWALDHITGGSSGGSAAAVAAGLCYAAIGTDTAGSVREPASLCGCVGLKPTYGRVSKRGVFPLSYSLDHVGVLATTVTDAAIVLQTLAGYDLQDPASADVPVTDYVSTLSAGAKSLRVGVPRDFFFEELDPEVAAAMQQALAVLRTLVAEMRDLHLDPPTDRTLQAAESYAVHAEDMKKAPELYQPATSQRLQSGAGVSAADYIRHRTELDQLRREAGAIFDGIDALVTPATSTPAPAIAQLKKDPDALRPAELRLLRNTRPFNVWGLPAISVPCGFTEAGLPIGLQVVGSPWREDVVLRLAHAYEQATAWHKRRPRVP
jgi:aspartyl-tRNA(Asn)/glutamyl-tRNA(Gln) amidotransferase subunit A